MNRRFFIALGALAMALAAVSVGPYFWSAGPQPAGQQPPVALGNQLQMFPTFFQERTATGVDFLHSCGDGGKYFMPEVFGSGLALLDYDCDGKLDLFVVQGMPARPAPTPPTSRAALASPTSRLYRQEADGRFRDVTEEAGLTDTEPFGTGVAVGDVNNDGWPDLYVTKFGADKLFLNRAGRFEDITARAGIENPRWGSSAAFGDFDRDGWLDLFVTNYLDYYPSQQCVSLNGTQDYCAPRQFPDSPSRLFRNVSGESAAPDRPVRFQDVSLDSGIDGKLGPGLGVLVEDLTGDAWPDIFVANDGKANFLWVNQKNGTFSEEAILAGAAYDRAGRPQANMGIASGDVDANGLSDLVVTHLAGEYDTLYLQLSAGVFEDRSIDAGLAGTIPPTGFGTALCDFDLDGDLDLAITNGRIGRHESARLSLPEPAAFWQAYAERNAIFVNTGGGKFVEAQPASQPFCQGEHVARGLAIGDLDNDGDLDLVTSEVNGPARIYENVAPRQGNWLQVRAVLPSMGSRDAYGAVVTLEAGDLQLSRTVNPGQSYLSSHDPRVHFGLAAADRIAALRVRWPDGAVESFPVEEVNRELTLRQGEGETP